jgi:hypothetical protein
MATVKNIDTEELRLIRTERLSARPASAGVNLVLAPQESGTVPDDFTISEGFVALLNANKVSILSYEDDDILVPGETAQTTSVYLASMDNTPADFPAADNAAAVALGGTETFDFSNPNDRTLDMVLNGVSVSHTFAAGDFSNIAAGTAAEVAASLDGNADFAAQADAADNTGDIDITSLALGTSSTLAFSGAADAILDLQSGVTNGTGAPSTVELLITKPDGTPAPGVTVTVESFDAVTAGSSGPATAAFQLAAKGTIATGEFANPVTVTSDANGEVDFEYVQAFGGADSGFIDVAVPAGFFLADSDRKGVDSTREEVVRS